MLINAGNLSILFQGFSGAFAKGMQGAKSYYKDISMVVKSGTGETKYGWLGQFPNVREWLGDRVVQNLVLHDYAIVNRLFEQTIAVKRTEVEDDQYGVFGPLIQEMGKVTAEHPDTLIFGLLAQGFATVGYDGQFFFDTDHPVGNQEGPPTSVSNMQAGSETPWFLLDTSRAIKPLIFQERLPYEFQRFDKSDDERVFKRDEYIYGVRGRSNVGLGLWQLAFGSKVELTAANYEAARVAMMNLKGDEGRPLGIMPDTLVVPPSLEGAAMRLLNNGERVELVDVGGNDQAVAVTNEWAGTAKVIVSPWLAA